MISVEIACFEAMNGTKIDGSKPSQSGRSLEEEYNRRDVVEVEHHEVSYQLSISVRWCDLAVMAGMSSHRTWAQSHSTVARS